MPSKCASVVSSAAVVISISFLCLISRKEYYDSPICPISPSDLEKLAQLSKLPAEKIFFIELKRISILTQLAVASAARRNPNSSVNLIVFGYPRRELNAWSGLNNVRVTRMDGFCGIFARTPIQDWYVQNLHSLSSVIVEGRIPPSQNYRLIDLSDALRYALLFKFGGLYLDTDFIVLRSFAPLWSQEHVAQEKDDSMVANSFMLFPQKNSPFLNLLLSRIPHYYKEGEFGSIGPRLISRIRKESSSEVNILQSTAIFPISYREIKLLTESRNYDTAKTLTNSSMALHLWRQYWIKHQNEKLYLKAVAKPGSILEKFLRPYL